MPPEARVGMVAPLHCENRGLFASDGQSSHGQKRGRAGFQIVEDHKLCAVVSHGLTIVGRYAFRPVIKRSAACVDGRPQRAEVSAKDNIRADAKRVEINHPTFYHAPILFPIIGRDHHRPPAYETRKSSRAPEVSRASRSVEIESCITIRVTADDVLDL